MVINVLNGVLGDDNEDGDDDIDENKTIVGALERKWSQKKTKIIACFWKKN